MEYLLQKGAEPNPRGNFGTPLHAAAFKDHLEVVEELLEHQVNENLDKAFKTALQATFTGGQETVTLTILKSSPSTTNVREYEKLITRAAQASFILVINYLQQNFEHGQSAPLPTKARLIRSAILNRSLPVLRRLLSVPKDHVTESQPELPHVAVSVASPGGHTDIVMQLLEFGGDIEKEGFYGGVVDL